MASHDQGAASVQPCRATWSDEVSGLALLYVYAPDNPGPRKGESLRQLTAPAEAVLDYAEDGRLLGVEVIATLPK